MEIESNIPLPSEDKWAEPTETIKKPKHRARRKKKAPNPAQSLLDAIKFIKPCQKKAGTPQQQFCCIKGNWIAASSNFLTIGTKVEEDLEACPQTTQLEEALKQVEHTVSIAQVSDTTLSVVSGELKALIQCVSVDQIAITPPDPRVAFCDDRIKAAFSVLAPLATEGASNAVYASVLLQSGSAVATNGPALVEYWHGIDLPSILVPKQAVAAIAKTKKSLTGFGYSGSSATFWFEDDSFIKTQLYNEQYVNYEQHLEGNNLEPIELHEDFFKATKTISKFTKSGIVYFENGKLASHELEQEASTYSIEGLPDGLSFNTKWLLMVESVFKKVHFDYSNNVNAEGESILPRAYFFGENTRGILLGVKD